MSGARRTRDLRWELFSNDPHCHWCGCVTLWDVTPGKVHKAAATLDHLCRSTDDRFVVLACFECNQLRERFKHLARNERERRHIAKRIALEIEWFTRRLQPDWATRP